MVKSETYKEKFSKEFAICKVKPTPLLKPGKLYVATARYGIGYGDGGRIVATVRAGNGSIVRDLFEFQPFFLVRVELPNLKILIDEELGGIYYGADLNLYTFAHIDG